MNPAVENSSQDRRVYVGNLSYHIKWGQLKDFMRQGMIYILVVRLYAVLIFTFFSSGKRRFC